MKEYKNEATHSDCKQFTNGRIIKLPMFTVNAMKMAWYCKIYTGFDCFDCFTARFGCKYSKNGMI